MTLGGLLQDYLLRWQTCRHLLLISMSKYGEPSNAYKMDLNERVWTKVHVPVEHSGHVESGCCLII
ncbi:hypothetical protein Hanom_Chr12g01175751 [Helianthus anomalus]